MLNMTITMKARAEKHEELLRAVHFALDGEDRNPMWYQGFDDATAYLLIIEWRMREDLERYVQTKSFNLLLGALKVLCEKSEISLWDHPANGQSFRRPMAALGLRWKPVESPGMRPLTTCA